MIKGRCECGGVAFEVARLRETVTNCHCGQCRKMSGHYLALTRAQAADITFTSDATLTWYRSSPDARRGFCGTCGSSLFFHPTGAPHYGIAAGCLEGPTGMATTKHIFVADKGDYYEIDDGLPQLEGYT
ncbi:Gfa-like protein [Candidatus Rhodobacter oscarellae]|uniref:Gfa-like protein n=1 Tax=Candidatus Rhodobacter oscarellae TaxID=1675527 RepID=A0A0J9E5X1_9RHOB|nr:GFA family protein [Candidatus Rhodobacter lobularis]KMW58112.1 Gfa-like protein [Candidatus Rhodobacter lobularis]